MISKHELAFVNLQVPMYYMDSEFILDAVGKDELQGLLKVDVGDLTLISIMRKSIITFPWGFVEKRHAKEIRDRYMRQGTR